jgi:hypothetical protein
MHIDEKTILNTEKLVSLLNRINHEEVGFLLAKDGWIHLTALSAHGVPNPDFYEFSRTLVETIKAVFFPLLPGVIDTTAMADVRSFGYQNYIANFRDTRGNFLAIVTKAGTILHSYTETA